MEKKFSGKSIDYEIINRILTERKEKYIVIDSIIELGDRFLIRLRDLCNTSISFEEYNKYIRVKKIDSINE